MEQKQTYELKVKSYKCTKRTWSVVRKRTHLAIKKEKVVVTPVQVIPELIRHYQIITAEFVIRTCDIGTVTTFCCAVTGIIVNDRNVME